MTLKQPSPMSLTENPYTRMLIRQKVDAWLKTIPDTITSIHHPKLFAELTGLTQSTLESNWDKGGRLTSCNSFAGQYSMHAIPAEKLKTMLAMFDLEGAVKKMGIPEAWKRQEDDLSARPGYGDIVRWKRLHVGVSLGFEGGKWHTLEGGQGGPSTGFDAIKRRTRTYNPGEILGWVDLVVIWDHDL